MQGTLKSRMTAEFIGTYILIFAGTGAIITNSLTGVLGHLGVALTFAFALVALIYAFGHISGAHFNPAVTFAFCVIGEFDKKDLVPYMLIQVIAAICASASLYFIFKDNIQNLSDVAYLGTTLPRGAILQSFVLEVICTFMLMIVICASAVHAKSVKAFAGLAIGLTLAVIALFDGTITGASVNPARSIGPALISGHFQYLWIYIIAPFVGATIAAVVYKGLLSHTLGSESEANALDQSLEK